MVGPNRDQREAEEVPTVRHERVPGEEEDVVDPVHLILAWVVVVMIVVLVMLMTDFQNFDEEGMAEVVALPPSSLPSWKGAVVVGIVWGYHSD